MVSASGTTTVPAVVAHEVYHHMNPDKSERGRDELGQCNRYQLLRYIR